MTDFPDTKGGASKMEADAAFAGWNDQRARPPMGSLSEPTDIRMYPPLAQPRAAALSSDELDIDGPWHRHDMHQLMCAFEGALEIEIQDGRHVVPCRLAAWIPAGVVHRVSLRRVRSGSIFLPVATVPETGDRVRTVLVPPLMREMVMEAMRWPPHSPLSALRSAFFGAFAGLCAEWITREADLYLPKSADARVQRALDHVESQPVGRFKEACHNAGMSERSLRRHLKLSTGMTLEDYRSRVRMLRAITLLTETSLSIAQVAADCGFESQSAFARAFRGLLHESPSAYRMARQRAT